MLTRRVQYTAHAVARGKGRDGEVKSDDDAGLSLRLGTPQSLGGQGNGNNPEQLFAMGYAGAWTAPAVKDWTLTALQHVF